MIHRVRHRRTFADLQRSPARGWAGPVGVVYLPPVDSAPGPPQVAFAIGRRVGGAVERNRVRRRLRVVFRELAAEPGALPPGAYLIRVRPEIMEKTLNDMKILSRLAVQTAIARGIER